MKPTKTPPQNRISNWRGIVGSNVLLFLLFLWLFIYIKVPNQFLGLLYAQRLRVLERLFSEPFYENYPLYGLLTNVSEILWGLGASICWFSFGLLNTVSSHRKINTFILCSALLLSIFFADDIFRLTLILSILAKIPKFLMYGLYGVLVLAYVAFFWRIIVRKTPYWLLIAAIALLIVSGLADLIHVRGGGTPVMLEDGTKLLGILNIALYFWNVCTQQIAIAFSKRETKV